MTAEWSTTIDSQREYFILKRDDSSNEYIFLRKPYRGQGREKVMEIFTAESDQEAKEFGANLANKYGLLK